MFVPSASTAHRRLAARPSAAALLDAAEATLMLLVHGGIEAIRPGSGDRRFPARVGGVGSGRCGAGGVLDGAAAGLAVLPAGRVRDHRSLGRAASRSGLSDGSAARVHRRVENETGEGSEHALGAVFIGQPVAGLGAVPILGLVSGLVVVGAARWFHEHHPTPSSTLEVNMGDRYLTIGELAKRTGVATSALRYYEDLGLLPAPSRVSGQRRYPNSAVGLVGTILLLRDVGFSLRESKAFLASRTQAVDSWRSLTQGKLTHLDEQIAKAQTAKEALTHALHCPHDDITTCPTFTNAIAARLAGRPLEEAHPH
jgi:DNA-binding transcriptional MerR regulator